MSAGAAPRPVPLPISSSVSSIVEAPTPRQVSAPAWLPPSLRAAPGATELWNALLSQTGRELPLQGQVRAVVALDEAGPAASALRYDLRFAAGPDLVLVPVSFPFAAAFEADLAVEDLALLPDALREAIGEGLVALLAAALPEHGLGAVDLVGSGPLAALSVDRAARLRWFAVELRGLAPEPARMQVGANLDALAAIFGGAPPFRPVWPGLKAVLTREADFTLGRIALRASEVRGLAPGTILVLEGGPDAALARLRIGDEVFHFRAADAGWTLAGIALAGDAGVQGIHNGDGMAPSDSVGSIADRLDIAVDLDLGRITVPLAELESWQVGSVVAMQPPGAAAGVEVGLRANGRLIGTGELVQVDDRLAVRISRLSPG